MKNLLKISLILGIFIVLAPIWVGSAHAVVISAFSAAPEYIAVPGDSITLRWSAAPTNLQDPYAQIRCYGSGGDPYDSRRWGGFEFDPSGSFTVTPTKIQEYSYSLTCDESSSHSVGSSDQKTIKVYVGVLPPNPTPYPTANPTPYPTSAQYIYPSVNLYSNTNNVLSWNTSNAYSCYASNGWSGSKNLNGSEQVYPYSTTIYTLTCTSYTGQQASDSETIYASQYYPPNPAPVGQALGAACDISPSSPTSPRIGSTVTFSAVESGGTAPYYYSWSGEVSGTSKSVSKTFSTTGEKTTTVRITDALGRTASGTCNTNVLAAAPAPTPKSTATPGQVQGATTVCKTVNVPVTVCVDSNGKIIETTPSPTPTQKPTPTPTEISETETDGDSFLASIFNVSDETWAKIKSLLKWYLAILAIILFVAIAYFVIKRVTGKEVK